MSPRPSGAEDSDGERELLTSDDVARTIARMAHQVIEKTAFSSSEDAPVLLGIPTRGAHVAARLGSHITRFSGIEVPVGTVDVTLYRDDLRSRPTKPLAQTHLPDCGIDNRVVVLTDDVLFSGRTIRAALDALRELGRPRAVQLAVLVDRGHRELPIRADYVGKNTPTSRGEDVRVLLSEVDDSDAVLLRPAAGGQR